IPVNSVDSLKRPRKPTSCSAKKSHCGRNLAWLIARGLAISIDGRACMFSVIVTSRRSWVLGAMLLLAARPAFAQTGYTQTNLVSNIPGLALVTDPSLVNPWGMAASGTSPWWVADNGTDLSTLYNGTTGAKQGLVVGIPDGAPTGLVFNSTVDF